MIFVKQPIFSLRLGKRLMLSSLLISIYLPEISWCFPVFQGIGIQQSGLQLHHGPSLTSESQLELDKAKIAKEYQGNLG